MKEWSNGSSDQSRSEKRIQRQEGAVEKVLWPAWFRGAGIAPSKTGLKLRLNVTPDANAKAEEIPKQFRGFDVEVVFIDTYKIRQLG